MATDPHQRFRDGLAAGLAGILPDDEQAWHDSHATACDSCRALAERTRARLPQLQPELGHAPVELLSMWVRTPSRLTPLERELLQRHLVSCELCREELRIMAELAGAPVPALVPHHAVTPHWQRWAQFGGLVAATLLFVVLIRRPGMEEAVHDFRPGDTNSALVSPTPAPTSAPGLASGAIPVVVFPETLRSTDSTALVIARVAAGTRRLGFQIPMLFMDSDSAEVAVVTSAGALLQRAVLATPALDRTFVLERPSAWPAGDLELVVSPNGVASSTHTRRFAFRIVSIRE